MGEQLEGMGFLPVGMVRFQLGRATSLWPILLSPDRNSFVVCNDRFVTVCSRFGPRLLVTIGSGHAPVSPTVLRISVPGGTVAEMVNAHHRSLEHLAPLGYRPDELDEFALIDEYIEREARELAWASSLSWLMGLRAWANVTLRIHMDTQPLDQNATSLERIHRWWESGSLSHSPPTTDYIA